MATISEDYVSFETAKLLKEKGFDEGCSFVVSTISKGVMPVSWPTTNSDIEDEKASLIALPTLQMAMKWLREIHSTSIEITSTGYLIDNDVEWECDIKVGHRLYFKHITGEKSFESVAEKAIKYCLENLI